MASYARCFSIFFLLALSFSLQIQARESKFFTKYTHHHRKTLENTESINISLSPTQSPSLAPAPAPESADVEHGYGLYGREPVKTADVVGDVKYVNAVGDVKYVEAEDMGKKTFRDYVMPNSNDNGNGWSRNGNGIGNENRNEYESEKKGMSDTRFLENGKYYYDVNTEGNGKEKQEMSEYVEDENKGNGNEKQGMSEYVEDENNFPENEENGNGYEIEKEETGEKRYLVNGKYYSGYVTGSKNRNGNEKQGMSEYVEDGYSFPKIEGNGNGNGYQETEKQEMGEKRYLVNGKYYTGYVTKSENGNGNEKQGMTSEYVEDENRYPENEGNGNGNGNGYETEKKYLVNGKYYSGYVTKSETGNENEKQGMSEYVADENSIPENKGYGYENEKQEVGEKKYLVNGKYYNGYVTKSENEDRKNQNYDEYEDLGAFSNKNENEFYDGNNEYVREGQEQEYGERKNEYAP